MTEPTPPSLKQLSIDRGSRSTARKRRWGIWVAAALAVLAAGVFALRPGKVEVQVTSVVTAYPSQQYAQLTASGYVVAQRRAAVASKATGRLVVAATCARAARSSRARCSRGSMPATCRPPWRRPRPASARPRPRWRQAHGRAGINADAELTRTQALQAQGFVSPQAVDTVRHALSTRATALGAGVTAEAQAVAVARAQLKVQQVNLDFTEIRAPFDGVVLVKNANVGDIITPFSSAAGTPGRGGDDGRHEHARGRGRRSESNLAKARIGQPVEITLDALPDRAFAAAWSASCRRWTGPRRR